MNVHRGSVELTLAEIFTAITDVDFTSEQNKLDSPCHQAVVTDIVGRVYMGHALPKNSNPSRLPPQISQEMKETEVASHLLENILCTNDKVDAFAAAIQELEEIKGLSGQGEQNTRLNEWLGRQKKVFGDARMVTPLFIYWDMDWQTFLHRNMQKQAAPELQ